MVNCTEENYLMDKDCAEAYDNFTFCFFENDDEPYFDMDFSGNNSPREANRESEEFEFSVSISATDKPNITEHVDAVSPADDLFYRGQLLPLHLPPRLQMVKNLSSPNEHEGDTTGLDRYSSDSTDSNQRPSCCKEPGCRPVENEEKTHMQSAVKSANKLKVKIPIFGCSKFSKVGMDDLNYSPSPTAKPLRFILKHKCMKVASLLFLTTEYSTKQSPDYPFNSIRTSTSAKHIVQKYVRLVKRRISSQKHDGAHTGDQQLKMDEGCRWSCIARPCIADESGTQTHLGFRHLDVNSSPPSMNSSPSFSIEDLQSAIDYCKISNGVIDTHRGL